jgi:hypothetical protein
VSGLKTELYLKETENGRGGGVFCARRYFSCSFCICISSSEPFFSVSVLAAENLLKQTQLWCGGVVSVPFAVLYAQEYLAELMFRRRIGNLRTSLTWCSCPKRDYFPRPIRRGISFDVSFLIDITVERHRISCRLIGQ